MGLKIVPGIFKKIPLLTSPAFSSSVCKERDSILFIQYPVLVGRPSHPKRSGTCFFLASMIADACPLLHHRDKCERYHGLFCVIYI